MGCHTGQGGGCGRIFGAAVVLALLGMALEKFGCIATDDVLRHGVSVSITAKEILTGKNLLVVHYTVTNDTRWPVCVKIDWAVTATTGAGGVTNAVELAHIPPKTGAQQRVMFDMDRLKGVGMEDPLDPDRCLVGYKITSIKESE